MSKVAVAITSIKPAEHIIDILNGRAMIYIQNPYAAPECITKIPADQFFKIDKTNKYADTSLVLPNIYINNNENQWTKDYLFTYGSKTEKVGYKIMPPFSDKGIIPEKFEKATQKLFVNLGSITDEKKQVAFIEWQICQAFEFAIYSKILNIDISKFKTDKEFISAVYLALGSTEPDTIEVYLENIKNKIVNVKVAKGKKSNDEDDDEDDDFSTNVFDFGAISKDAFKSYIDSHSGSKSKNTTETLDKKNPCLLYFYKSKQIQQITFKQKFQVIQFNVKDEKTGVLKPIEALTFNAKFTVLYNPESQARSMRYITQCSNKAVKKGIHPMTIKDFQFKDKIKFSGMLVLTLTPTCNIYKITSNNIIRSESLDWSVTQITMDKNAGASTNVDLFIEEDDDDDGANEDADAQGDNDAEINGLM